MKPERDLTDSGDSEETRIRPMPDSIEDLETMVLPHPDETLILEQNDPLFEGIPASNPFCIRASSILSLVPKLRVQVTHDNVNALRIQLVDELKEFEAIDPKAGISAKQNQVASYFLCALLDETILNTPWGRQCNWRQHSLLYQFHGDGQEGRKFFVLLKQLVQDPKQYIHLIELAYICLSLGYEGVYQKTSGGQRTIAHLRQKLFDMIQEIKGPDEDILSSDWQGIQSVRRPVVNEIPLWVSLVIAGVVLLLIYFSVIYLVNRDSDRVAQRLDRLAQKEPVQPNIPPITKMPVVDPLTAKMHAKDTEGKIEEKTDTAPADSAEPVLNMDTFKEALAYEIKSDRVQILEGPTLRIVNAFRSGSDQVRKEYLSLLTKIARVLEPYDRRILVVGHTDNQPMFSGRFPSNWHLSEARAKSVAGHLAVTERLAERIRFEGHGASEPIAANDTEQHRALNRRIDIHIR